MSVVDCGIDIGSTNLKVVFVGAEGRVLITRSIPSPREKDDFGVVTNPVALVAALESLIIDGWRELGAPHPLRSITSAGVGEDGFGVTAGLMPMGNAIPWFDKRAAEEVRALQSYSYLAARTGIAIEEPQTAAKWLWLHKHRPQDLETAHCWITLTDFPIAWWSGKNFMSSSLAPRTACFDIHTRTWVSELLAATHAPNLPPVINAGQVVGGVRKGPLRESGAASVETLLVAGGHDHPIAAAMIRRLDREARVDSMGTANLVYGETSQFSDPALVQKLAFSVPPAGNGFACLGVLELSAALNTLPDSSELRSYLDQRRFPGAPPKSIHGLRAPGNKGEVLIRRTLEDASLKARDLLAVMDKAGVPKGTIYTTGGWSRSIAFVELRASVFGQEIVALGDLELTALGAALYGAEAATGKSMCPILKEVMTVVEPVTAWLAAYEDLFASFTNLS